MQNGACLCKASLLPRGRTPTGSLRLHNDRDERAAPRRSTTVARVTSGHLGGVGHIPRLVHHGHTFINMPDAPQGKLLVSSLSRVNISSSRLRSSHMAQIWRMNMSGHARRDKPELDYNLGSCCQARALHARVAPSECHTKAHTMGQWSSLDPFPDRPSVVHDRYLRKGDGSCGVARHTSSTEEHIATTGPFKAIPSPERRSP